MSRVRKAALQLAGQLGLPLRQGSIPNILHDGGPGRLGICTLLGFSALVVVALAVLFSADLVRQYQTVLKRRQSLGAELRQHHRLQHTARGRCALIEGCRLMMDVLKEAALVRGADSSGGKVRLQLVALKETPRYSPRTSPLVMALGWTDNSGKLCWRIPYAKDPPRLNISDLPHFIAQRDAGSDELYVSPPFKSAATGQWICATQGRSPI